MSRTKITPAEQHMLGFPCRRCHAKPQEWCVTIGGHHAGLLHAERYYDWKAIQARLQR